MARAIEKGATYIDKLCHKFYDEQKGHGKKSDYVCRICGGPLETYYCEDRLYLVRCADCGTLALVKAANPGDAARVTLARPTLTPPNGPLTPEQLREMDEPVWVACKPIEGGKGYWCLCQHGHIITPAGSIFDVKEIPHWVLYRRPPEGEA